MTWKIIADSGCDYRQLAIPAIDTTFVSVPLTIQVADQVFVDDASLDIDQMMKTMYATAEASKSACPNPDDYLRAFEGAKNIFHHMVNIKIGVINKDLISYLNG